MPLVTFLSDFGWRDHYVAAVKAKILAEDPSIHIVDITHNIKKFDIIHAAHVLKSVYQDFPEGTIHLVAINLQSQPKEDLIAIELNKHIFLGSNNGLMSLISENAPSQSVKLSLSGFTNFAAKDVLAPASVALAKGKKLGKLGDKLEEADLTRFMPLRVKANRELIQGHVVHVDDYGNLITNISKVDYDILSKDKNVLIKFRNYGLPKVLNHYHDTKGGEAFAIFNAEGFLEIGIKEGNAAELLGLEYSSMVTIKFDSY
jgi:S-adenosylmethionine hydrolase